MKKMRISELKGNAASHVFEEILPGAEIYHGGMFFAEPGERSHANDHGSPVHTHEDCELFLFLQGKAVVEIDGAGYPAEAGDIYVAEPGEDHHIISDREEPPVGLWCHARNRTTI